MLSGWLPGAGPAALADALARQALVAMAGSLLVALALGAGLWAVLGWLRRRSGPWRQRQHERQGRRAGWRVGGLGAALLVAAGAALAFAALAEATVAGSAPGLPGPWVTFDGALALALQQHLPAAALPAIALLSHAGDRLTLTVLGAVVALGLLRRGDRGLATAWVLGLVLNGLLIRGLKALGARARPLHLHDALVVVDGYSFPSGHASASTVAYGLLAYLVVRRAPARWHLPAVLVALVLALGIGWSRVLLQVHFASDVLAGWAAGVAWLTACVLVIERAVPAPPAGARGAVAPPGAG